MAKVVFFCRVPRKLLATVEFYRQDIEAIQALGHEVIVATRLRDVPFRFDYMFVWWWTHAALPVFFCNLLGRPSFVTGTFNFKKQHGGIDYFSRPSWQRILIRYAVKGAGTNVFVSRYEKTQCEEYFQLQNAEYCPHILEDDYLQGPGPNRELSILNIAWSSKSNLRRKGVPLIIEAVALLKRRGCEVRAYLAGHEGDGHKWLRHLIEEHAIGSNIELLGELSRDEKIRRLRSCELYVQPSNYEGFGLAQAEAMGCGACVITCKVGAVEEVVGDAGIYVNPGDAAELADAIEKVLTNPAVRKRYQRTAVDRMRQAFSAEKKLERFERMFVEGKKKRPAR